MTSSARAGLDALAMPLRTSLVSCALMYVMFKRYAASSACAAESSGARSTFALGGLVTTCTMLVSMNMSLRLSAFVGLAVRTIEGFRMVRLPIRGKRRG